MNTDEELGQWLRQELLDHESHRPPKPDLARLVITQAPTADHRRTWLVAVGAAAAAAAIVGAVMAGGPRSRPSEPTPGGSPTGSAQEPEDPTGPPTLLAAAWAATLPSGAPPEVPYANQTALHLPSGQLVDLGSTDAVVIGDTVAGTVLLIQRDETDSGGEFRSWYAVVASDGTVTRLDTGRITGNRVQEAVVSPDGHWFSDGQIFDMTTGQVTGSLAPEADILLAWTPAGIVYGAGAAAYLWSPGGAAPMILDRWPATYPNETDVGLGRRDGCPVVVRLSPEGTEQELSRRCGVKAMTVSPAGTWLLTLGLVAIDAATGEEHPLTDRPIREVLGYAWDGHWLNEDEVLLSVPGGGYQAGGEMAPSESAILIRCQLEVGTCERATTPVPGVGPNQRLTMP